MPARVVIHNQVFDELGEGIVDGFYEAGLAIIERNKPNVPVQAPPVVHDRHLRESGRVLVFRDGRKVRDSGSGRYGRLKVPRSGIALYVTYGFPARFLEVGTVRMAPHPFATGAINAGLHEAAGPVRAAVDARLGTHA